MKLLAKTPGETLMKFGVVQEAVTWFADLPLGAGPPDDFLAIRVRRARLKQ